MTKQKSTEEKEHNKGSFKDRYKKCLSELKKNTYSKYKR